MKKEDLRIVFMGTPDFAVTTLNALVREGFNIVGVITAPDRGAGRGRKVKMSAVKEYAIEKNLKILQPLNLKDEEFLGDLKKLKPNLQIVVAFRMLPKIVWSLPELGTFNLHASLLPQYRSAAPINFAIINGESQTGLTTFFLDEEIDTGSIISQVKTIITNKDTAGSLHDKMMLQGSILVIDTINKILNNDLKLVEQKRSIKLKSAPKLQKEDCKINWNKDSNVIYNFIRGLSPYPASFSTIVSSEGKQLILKIFNTLIITDSKSSEKPGTIISDEKSFMDIVTKTGKIRILELQLAGKKKMVIGDFLRGFQNILDYHLE